MKKIILAITLAIALVVPAIASANHSEEVGIVDIPLPSACVITSNITLGSNGADVTCLQQRLVDLQLLPSTLVTGYFGPRTKAALVHWQKLAGVPATGYFGAISRARFDAGVIASVHPVQTPTQPESATSSTMAHPHVPVDVSTWPMKPSVTFVLHPDSMSGYNVEIVPVNFAFAPQHVNGAIAPNEGHAHLMINGKKIARVYGAWFHVGKEYFSTGQNEVLVTLNANDHSELSVDGSRIEAHQTVTIN
ncbi:MAG: peptidoglycan-binding protein [Candidatus Pacebacteria bacterium]|nr:peptidoglycan-binding protein [Candidatus Paceibacterota bacterium]